MFRVPDRMTVSEFLHGDDEPVPRFSQWSLHDLGKSEPTLCIVWDDGTCKPVAEFHPADLPYMQLLLRHLGTPPQ